MFAFHHYTIMQRARKTETEQPTRKQAANLAKKKTKEERRAKLAPNANRDNGVLVCLWQMLMIEEGLGWTAQRLEDTLWHLMGAGETRSRQLLRGKNSISLYHAQRLVPQLLRFKTGRARQEDIPAAQVRKAGSLHVHHHHHHHHQYHKDNHCSF